MLAGLDGFLLLAAALAVTLAYTWVLGRTGSSVGKRVVGGRFVRGDSHRVPGCGRALGRTSIVLLLTSPLFVPLHIAYAAAAARPDRMTLQDLATGTRPVRVLKKSETPATLGLAHQGRCCSCATATAWDCLDGEERPIRCAIGHNHQS
ncbi:RDD family protein [uncultured Serinicoccus sp.]|uniref:RDD family protein n=1 Tax=uncultured Serinicoccus sp. TaxID=735514 RepID=UPI003432E093